MGNCNCDRALNINLNLAQLEAIYIEAVVEQNNVYNDINATDKLNENFKSVIQKQSEVQNILRTHVSIQVSVPPGKETRCKAAYVVGEVINIETYVHDVIKSVKSLVNDLLNTETCEKCLKKETSEYIISTTPNEQDFNFNVQNSKVLSKMTIKTEENKDDSVDTGDYVMPKNKRKRKQIFFKRQQDNENCSRG